jgi:hypothetical protein
MKVMFPSKLFVLTVGLALSSQVLTAQGIQIFSPVYTRPSPNSLSFAASYTTPYTLATATVSVSCPVDVVPTGTLSGPLMQPDGSAPLLSGDGQLQPGGNLLVDNNVVVTVTPVGGPAGAPRNACAGGINDGSVGPSNPPDLTNNCFNQIYRNNLVSITGKNPDTFTVVPYDGASTAQTPDFFGGVPPADISNDLYPASGQTANIAIALTDEGGTLVSSTIFLQTNCTINGVSSGTAAGNPITDGSGKTQTFKFNPLDTKKVDFTYDVGGVTNFNGGTNGSIPQTTDSPIDATRFRPDWVAKTPFATSSCFVHFGEVLDDGITSACKLYTLECLASDGSTITGANCPKSSAADEKVVDHFDGPALLGLPNIYNTAGKLIARQGVGFLMASEDWAPALPTPAGQCTFEAASGLSGVSCPQNLLRDFSGPGIFSGTGLTTNPNSTFISIYGVPQPLTVATLQGAKAGSWVNTNKPQIGFVTTPPNFTAGAYTGNNVPLDGAANFIPAPIKGITYGISTVTGLPTPLQEPVLNAPVTGTDKTLLSKTCPTSFSALTQPSFGPPKQTISALPDGTTPIPDGQYLVHYYAQDCAGTQELQFKTGQIINEEPVWATSFYTIPVNIDTTVPVVTISNPPPSPATPTYLKLNSTVYAFFNCTDASSGSGVTHCGSNLFALGTFDTGQLQMKINTSSLGQKTLTITGSDGAGNSSSKSVTYTVTK